MSDAAQSQAIMFEPIDEEQPLAGQAGPGSQSVGGIMTRPVVAVETEAAPTPEQITPEQITPEQITFEQGYEELKGIVSRLDDPELPVHEMFEGFRRGKGLEKALRAYLQEREGELAELEEGNNLPEFEIASPSSGPVAN